ncbi:MAG: phosphoenolpyruvate carboxykinase (ATP) [Candidatus Paracaedibacteraceae bacterium]|nr:phosphoenolpyruvate carboxykinase (ATP) [Candidatus Paracaedibacteraceae bacterium]
MSMVPQGSVSQDLFATALSNHEGVLASNGALRVLTGERTGRSPKDKYIVRDAVTESKVNWGGMNQALSPDVFERLWQEACASLSSYPIYEDRLQVGSHPTYHITVRVQCNFAWHTLFCQDLFITPAQPLLKTEWHLVNAAHYKPDAAQYGLNGEAAIVLDFIGKRVLICGTHYAGEMKKAMFSVLNFLLPDQDVLPMHCAANKGSDGKTTLFFGLSGTGKTTLSADPERQLIGDDEHGWSADGVFNFEGGCYAKCIRLSKDGEPLIWDAIRQGSIMENVVLDGEGVPDYDDASITENTRVVYPLDFIPGRAMELVHGHPNSVIFLTCDLFGVLPPVARLNHDQVIDYFLVGYTALVGSTEFGAGQGIKTTFSACFGAPFFARPPKEYAALLVQRLKETGAEVYLVNTGWGGGSYGKGGERFPLRVTRRIVSAITSGEIRQCAFEKLQPFDLDIPVSLDGVDRKVLNPGLVWDAEAYSETAGELLSLFAAHKG